MKATQEIARLNALLTCAADGQPLVSALIAAVKMERDEFHERCNNSYSTDALMLAKERVALCKAAVLAAMCNGRTSCPPSGG